MNTSAITFAVPRTLDNGAKLVYVNYNQGRFSVQTPWMSMPWKMGAYLDGEYPKYSLDLSFKGMDENPDLKGFHDKLKEVEQKIIDGGLENSVAWFKKNIKSREGVAEKFNPIIKESRDKETGEPDGKWPPSMKVKVPRRDGVWEFKVSNKDGTQYKINDTENPDNCEDLFVKNTRVRGIIQCVGLWVASGNYMCQWKLTKAEVEVPETFSNDDFLDDSDNEDTVEHEFVEDSDKEEEVAVADTVEENHDSGGSEEPEPVKKVIKKVVRKKKPSN
jgi:hypothetical protein|tara:strand:+ start:1630 stop:2454 length:825 start_codon:yes stop_codon:yes gene_type:complete